LAAKGRETPGFHGLTNRLPTNWFPELTADGVTCRFLREKPWPGGQGVLLRLEHNGEVGNFITLTVFPQYRMSGLLRLFF